MEETKKEVCIFCNSSQIYVRRDKKKVCRKCGRIQEEVPLYVN